MTKTITIAYGDGIGPEIMDTTIQILQHAKADVNFNVIEVGKNIYDKGFKCGLMPSSWAELNNSKVLLKAPITTPQGSGYKSLNATIRTKLGLYANVRPVASFYPFIKTNFKYMDIVVIRENEEDLYMGVEHRQSLNSYQCLKIITKEGCEKIIRYAFEYAIQNNRRKVTCFLKDNIMKLTDGIFHKTFDEISKEYPEIENEHYAIDIATARVANNPELFDVIVTTNLYGDIVSDVVAEISGSASLAGSANIGNGYAMFETIHGSAPDIASEDIANPTGLINAAIMMLSHIGQNDIAANIRDALYKTIEDGIHTSDIFSKENSKKKVGTKEFGEHVIKNLGLKTSQLPKADFKMKERKSKEINKIETQEETKKLIGFDLFIDYKQGFENLLATLKDMESEKLEVKAISSKGLLLWPLIDKHMMPKISNDLIVLRFIGKGISGKSSNEITNKEKTISHQDIVEMLNILIKKEFDFVKYEGLYQFNGKAGYSQIQGE